MNFAAYNCNHFIQNVTCLAESNRVLKMQSLSKSVAIGSKLLNHDSVGADLR